MNTSEGNFRSMSVNHNRTDTKYAFNFVLNQDTNLLLKKDKLPNTFMWYSFRELFKNNLFTYNKINKILALTESRKQIIRADETLLIVFLEF